MNPYQYTTYSGRKERIKNLIVAILVVVELIVGIYVLFFEEEPAPTGWEHEYPMANANITWEGAGYNGVYGHDRK